MTEEQKTKILKIVKNNYNDIATAFDSTRKKFLWPELNRLVSEIKDGASILDVGCGNGRLIDSFSDKQINYLGVDGSEELIKLASSNYPDYKFLVCDILELDSLKEKRDLVFSVAVIHHLPGFDLRLKAIKQMLNATNNGGSIVFSVWDMWSNKKYKSLLFRAAWQKIIGRNKLDFGDLIFPWKNDKGVAISERYYHAFTVKELQRLMKLAEITDYKLYGDHYNYWVIINK